MEGKDHKSQEEELVRRFDSFCKKVLDHASYNLARDATRFLIRERTVGLDVKKDMKVIPGEEHEGRFQMSVGEFSFCVESRELADALTGMSENAMKILILSVVFEFSLTEISQMLGLTYGAVRAIKSRAMKEVRKKVKHERSEK